MRKYQVTIQIDDFEHLKRYTAYADANEMYEALAAAEHSVYDKHFPGVGVSPLRTTDGVTELGWHRPVLDGDPEFAVWEDYDAEKDKCWCSKCNHSHTGVLTKYCPHCGSRMMGIKG